MSFVKEVGLIIDLHQSPIQEESIFKQAASDLYIPLIRLIKSKRDMKITLSIPLSTLELLDKYGFESQIGEIKDLCMAERVDLVGSSAYGALLDDLPYDVIENQIILNEYALGYYLGARQGFEGEPSIMIKDLQGFVPAHFYISSQILKSIEGLGYKWVLTSNCCLPEKYQKPEFCVYKIPGSEVVVVKLDKEIIDIASSYKEGSISELKKKINNKINGEWKTNLFYIKGFEDDLDADSYKKEFELIDVLIETLEASKIEVVNVPDLIKRTNLTETGEEENLEYQKSSSEKEDDILSFYFMRNDEKLATLKSIDKEFSKIKKTIEEKEDLHDISTLPIWKEESWNQIPDSTLQRYVCYFILLSKFMSFNKYLYLNHCLIDPDRKETYFKQLHSFTHLVTRSLNIIPEYPEASKLRSKIGYFLSLLQP